MEVYFSLWFGVTYVWIYICCSVKQPGNTPVCFALYYLDIILFSDDFNTFHFVIKKFNTVIFMILHAVWIDNISTFLFSVSFYEYFWSSDTNLDNDAGRYQLWRTFPFRRRRWWNSLQNNDIYCIYYIHITGPYHHQHVGKLNSNHSIVMLCRLSPYLKLNYMSARRNIYFLGGTPQKGPS